MSDIDSCGTPVAGDPLGDLKEALHLRGREEKFGHGSNPAAAWP
ncbi:hypothetical protein ACFWM1_28080 [Nocardia sp. NPDC058379]